MTTLAEIPFEIQQLVIPFIFAIILTGPIVCLFYRHWIKSGWILELLYGLLASVVGTYFGIGSQIFYTSGIEIPLFGNGVENPAWLGGVFGGVFGFLAGVGFAQYLRSLAGRGYEGGEFVHKVVLGGITAGLLSASAVHALLMVAYRNMNFYPMLIGWGFGLVTGIVTGLVLCIIFILGRKFGFICQPDYNMNQKQEQELHAIQ